MGRPELNLQSELASRRFPRLAQPNANETEITRLQDSREAQGGSTPLEDSDSGSAPIPLPATSNSSDRSLGDRKQTDSGQEDFGIIYHSQRMYDLIGEARAYARSSASVLITGESGTGKELFGKLIHSQSRRSEQRFVQVNCAALSDHILESEFFGHAKGAFTGADQPRVGRFEWANGGTLLLDEVSEIPLRLQAKLLRVLEERVLQRVGCNLDHQIDVRVISTSNRNLEKAVAEGSFREDLFHRLNVLQLDIPPLRERMEDLVRLCDWFVKLYSAESEFEIKSIAPEAIKRLQNYTWPGNIRQLRNVICRACVLANSETIQSEQIKLADHPMEAIPDWLLSLSMPQLEKEFILANLKRFSGNKTKAAHHLGITSRTLHNKLKAYEEDAKAA